MPDFKTTDTLSDKQILAKAQELRSSLPIIEFSRGFGIVPGYLMVKMEQPPEGTGLTWVENLHDETIHTVNVEEEVELGD